MQTTSYSLPDILARASRKSLTIPQFQRDFTWNKQQMRLLVDSMSRSYPIGSLLLLLRSPEFEIGWRSLDAVIYDRQDRDMDEGSQSASSTDENHYVLDGQQRLTSIFRVFRNADPDKVCYFYLKDLINREPGNDTGGLKFHARNRSTGHPDRKLKNRYLRADIILDQHKTDVYVSEYFEDSEDFEEWDKTDRREAAARVKGIFETIRNYKVPVVVLERESGVESVCRVFETINSTGKRLTTFDLAVAKFFPEPDLRELWDKTLRQHPILREFEVDGERVLQVLHLVRATQQGKNYEPTRSNLFRLEREGMEQEWESASEALADTFRWVRGQGARPKSDGMKNTLPNESILVPLAAYRSLQKQMNSGKPLNTDAIVRHWYFSKIMQAGAAQASNYKISRDFVALRDYLEGNNSLEPDKVELNVDNVLDLKPSDVRYKALQNVFAITMREDLFGNMIESKTELDDHHIFPRHAHKQEKLPLNLLDSICNRILLSRSVNRSLGAEYPKDYLGDLVRDARRSGTLDGFARRMRDCLIPGDSREPSWAEDLNTSNFEGFCHKRAELIIESVRGIIGNALQTRKFRGDDDLPEEEE
ncbi:MAG: DUF262 domain-containing protein [Rhodobacteraceae bacterium]|nr:DUF262 domain-containing protein [Paracoccaceae bacterium]